MAAPVGPRAAVALAAVLALALASPAPVALAAPGFNASIARVSAAELGASWRPGCPVGPEQLRRVTLTHWGFDGAPHTGALVVHVDHTVDVVAVFRRLFEQRFAIERMETIDVYGGSDDASMAANNTSAFNCRAVTGGTAWSQHAYGWAIDVNPVQNPYVRGSTVLPPAGRAHLDRSQPGTGKILAGDGTVRAFAAVGWLWGGTWTSPRDYQHFELADRSFAGRGPNVVAAGDRTHAVGTAADDTVRHRRRTEGSPWSAWQPLGGQVLTDAEVASWDVGRLDVFAVGADASLFHRASGDGGASWTPWEPLGGGFSSPPAATSPRPGRIDVFARGLDGALWTISWLDTRWTAWTSLGGSLAAAPDAASWDPGRIDVVALGRDGALHHRAMAGGAWQRWESLGGELTSRPAAVSWGPDRLDVFARGGDGALWSRHWSVDRWSPWHSLGGGLASGPGAASAGADRLEVYAVGRDARLYRTAWNGAAWSGFTAVP